MDADSSDEEVADVGKVEYLRTHIGLEQPYNTIIGRRSPELQLIDIQHARMIVVKLRCGGLTSDAKRIDV